MTVLNKWNPGLETLHFQAKLIIPEPFAHSFGIQAGTTTYRHIQMHYSLTHVYLLEHF